MHSCNQLVDWVETDIKQYNKHELPVWTVAQQLHARTSIKQWLFTSQPPRLIIPVPLHCWTVLLSQCITSYHSFIMYCRLSYGFKTQNYFLLFKNEENFELLPTATRLLRFWYYYTCITPKVNFDYYVTISWRVERLLKWLKLKHGD